VQGEHGAFRIVCDAHIFSLEHLPGAWRVKSYRERGLAVRDHCDTGLEIRTPVTCNDAQ
jgi:hypothetical protein